MSTQIQFQSFCFKSSQVRVVTDPNQEYWFCGKDVCDILGYTNDSKALKDHCKEKGGNETLLPYGRRKTRINIHQRTKFIPPDYKITQTRSRTI
ncbi:Uncharacterized phage-encoded protein [Pasteurella multocida subsp. gallicida]|nr:BRO family protein [Pasteurella multocida]VEE38074.1 Uncharacterized phage-encoded protein [Pasteurella multocida subsp. gallicida]